MELIIDRKANTKGCYNYFVQKQNQSPEINKRHLNLQERMEVDDLDVEIPSTPH
jgi:hypothetical protein